VHGHLHSRQVMVRGFNSKPMEIDPRYFSVCMERVNFTPIALEDAKLQIKNRLESSVEI
jgi:hypothetical protein